MVTNDNPATKEGTPEDSVIFDPYPTDLHSLRENYGRQVSNHWTRLRRAIPVKISYDLEVAHSVMQNRKSRAFSKLNQSVDIKNHDTYFQDVSQFEANRL